MLGIEAIGIDDHFFRLGGDSLRALGLAARVREIFGIDAPRTLAFEAPIFEAMAARLQSIRDAPSARTAARTIRPGRPSERSEDLPASFAQQ